MSTASPKRGARTQHLVDTLRQEIISGHYPPGATLRQEELAEAFAASRMPVREALRTLDAEGLIQLQPNRGAVVAPIDVNELREITEMREAAETLAIRVALPHLSNARIDAAKAIQSEIETAPPEDFGALNKTFHCTLYEPAGRPRLLAHIRGLHDIAERYLRFTLSKLDYVERSSREHEAILNACYRRDTDNAEALTSRHILEAGKALEEFLTAT